MTINAERIADTSGVGIVYKEETNWGEAPRATGGSKASLLRLNSETFNLGQTYVESQELRPDYQTPDATRTLRYQEGGFSSEFSFGTFDPFMESFLFSNFAGSTSTIALTGTGIAAEATTGGVTTRRVTAQGSDVQEGQYIKLSGLSGGNADRLVRVVGRTSADAFTIGSNSETGLSASAITTGNITKPQRLVIGRANNAQDTFGLQSFTFEKHFPTGSGTQVMQLRGCIPNTFTLGVTAEELVTIGFDFMGMGGTVLDADTQATTNAPGTAFGPLTGVGTLINPATTSSILNAADNAGFVGEGDGASARRVASLKSITLNGNNNLRNQSVIGQVDLEGIGRGRLSVTASVEAYFRNWNLYERYLDDLYFNIEFALGRASGTGLGYYRFRLPRCKFNTATVVAQGVNQDVMISGDVTATGVDTDANTMLLIERTS